MTKKPQTLTFTEKTEYSDVFASLNAIDFDPNENLTDEIFYWLKALFKGWYTIKISYLRENNYFSLYVKRWGFEYVRPCDSVFKIKNTVWNLVLWYITNSLLDPLKIF